MDLSALPPELRTLADIGLGAASLLLWLRQGKVNKQQVLLDEHQNKVTEDLTTMVKDHDKRLAKLEKTRCHKARRARTRAKKKRK